MSKQILKRLFFISLFLIMGCMSNKNIDFSKNGDALKKNINKMQLPKKNSGTLIHYEEIKPNDSIKDSQPLKSPINNK